MNEPELRNEKERRIWNEHKQYKRNKNEEHRKQFDTELSYNQEDAMRHFYDNWDTVNPTSYFVLQAYYSKQQSSMYINCI